MKSPFTGKEMKRTCEKRTWNFRGEQYEYHHLSWLCEDTGESFTTDESDTMGFVQVTNQYRAKFGIPYTDEIVEVRKRYGISASKMSLILGFGTNQYRLYEQGEVPNVSNGRIIRSIMNPKVMLCMVESSKNLFTNLAEYEKTVSKINTVISQNKREYQMDEYEKSRIFSKTRGECNGYAPISLNRLKNIMLYVLEKCEEVWYTKMNKLLFYIDFVSYRERGMAMTGLAYKAINYGPVPDRWDKVYSEFPEIEQELRPVGEYSGSILKSNSKPDITLFTETELDIMNRICSTMGAFTAKKLSGLSHQEDAWIDYQDKHAYIPFDKAFFLKNVM